MNKTTISTILLFLVLSGFVNTSNSQTPYISIYFDQELQWMTSWCPEEPPRSTFDTLYVVAHNFDTDIISVEYRIDYSWALIFHIDIIDSGLASSGTSPSGITINFSSPLSGYGRHVVQRSIIWWECTLLDCYDPPIPVRVLAHPTSGRLGAVRWPDLTFVDAVGWTSIVCPSLSPVKSRTWGHIKSLYN